MLDHVLPFKGEVKKVNSKVVEKILFMIAHNGSGFDSYVVLNNLPKWRSIVYLIRTGAGIVFLKIINGHVDEKKYTNMFFLDVGEFTSIVV